MSNSYQGLYALLIIIVFLMIAFAIRIIVPIALESPQTFDENGYPIRYVQGQM